MLDAAKRILGAFLAGAVLLLLLPVAALPAAASEAQSWARQDSTTNAQLRGVTAADRTHIWAVGDGGTILFSDGEQWYREQSGQTSGIYDISAADATHVWAVGDTGEDVVLFYDGNTWKKQELSFSAYMLQSVHALDRNHVWAVGGGGKIAFYNGTKWVQQASPTTSELLCVHAIDSTHVWATGQNGTLLFYNGTAWSNRPSPTGFDIYTVSGCDPNHVLIAGDASVIFFWNGTKWRKTASAGWGNSLRCITYVKPDLAYGAGGGNEGDAGAVQVWNGSTWQPFSNGIQSALVMFFDICSIDANHAWIVGTQGTVYSLLGSSSSRSMYFAEGCTREGFDEWLCIQNPGAKDLTVEATYMLFGQEPVRKEYVLKPTSRASVHVNQEVGPGRDVSVKLQANAEFYAERSLYFDYKSGQPGFSWTGGHCATGARAPRGDWYFAEGTTRDGFEEWICIQNPNDYPVTVKVDYISAGAYTQQKTYPIDAQSRISVFANGDVGPNQDISLYVHSDDGIVAERPMYFNYHGKWTGGHDVMGTDTPRARWYFAEGSTGRGFEEWLAVQNANNADAGLTVTFMKTDGTKVEKKFTVGANSRWTLDASSVLGGGVDSSIVLESDQPVVAERPMYFDYKEGEAGYGWTGGHDVVGAIEPKQSWSFAEGCTRDNFDEYICVANPGEEPVEVTFNFMLETGQVVQHSIDVGAGSRATLKVADVVGRGHDVSTRVTAEGGVVAERPMYFNYNGVWTGGHDVIGF